jgi:hypothetical protein
VKSTIGARSLDLQVARGAVAPFHGYCFVALRACSISGILRASPAARKISQVTPFAKIRVNGLTGR